MSKILIIDNNKMNIEMASELLSRAGHNVISAEKSIEGIELAKSKNPALILMDLNMPVMDGLSATKLLKQNYSTKDIPVIAFTAMVRDIDKEQAFKSGCSGFITKPIDIANFVPTVENHLQKRVYRKKYLDIENEYITSQNNYEHQLKAHRILIVDDNQMNAELLNESMKQINQIPLIANSGRQALEIIAKDKIDMVLLDIMMPDMSGFEVIEHIKSNPLTKDIIVVFITALNETDNIVKGLQSGSYEYIVKPFNIDELKARLINILQIYDLKTKLLEEKNKLDLIFKFSADGLVLLDSDFKIVSCNDSFIKWFDSNKEDSLGKDFYEFLNCCCKNPNECTGIELLKKNSYNEITVKNKYGERVYQLNQSKFTDNKDNTEGYVLILRDITEHEKVEQQKETFVATLTHDLKTPIRAEIMAMELLLKGNFGKLNDEQAEIVKNTLYSSKYMFGMVDNLLSTYRYENGSVNLHREKMNIIDLIKSCYNDLKYLIDDKFQNVSFDFSNDDLMVYGDIIELKRVIMNLLSNAVNYTQEYGKIIIKSEIINKYAEITFIDNGKGISQNDISLLFNKFTSHAKKFRQVGTGLGLYLSKQIIEAHGGSISVSSVENKGSEFTISIPLFKLF
jgi:PAS domain S-box-containing protein